MRYFIIFTLNLFFISKCFSLEIESTNIYGKTNKEINLRILSSTDIEVFSPILNKFSQLNRNIAIEYLLNPNMKSLRGEFIELDAGYRLW